MDLTVTVWIVFVLGPKDNESKNYNKSQKMEPSGFVENELNGQYINPINGEHNCSISCMR